MNKLNKQKIFWLYKFVGEIIIQTLGLLFSFGGGLERLWEWFYDLWTRNVLKEIMKCSLVNEFFGFS